MLAKYIGGNAGGGVSKLVAAINFPVTATVSLNCPPLTALVMVELQELPNLSHLPHFSGWRSNNNRGVGGRRQTNSTVSGYGLVPCAIGLDSRIVLFSPSQLPTMS